MLNLYAKLLAYDHNSYHSNDNTKRMMEKTN